MNPYGAKTPEGKKRQQSGRRKHSENLLSIHGDTFRLNCGLVVTSSLLAKIAASKGLKISQSTMSRRLAGGLRDFDQLMVPPDQKMSELAEKARAGKVAKRAADAEFLAALAAVNARRSVR